MKIKLGGPNRKKYVSLILIVLMVGSTLAFSALQAFQSWLQPNVGGGAATPELPSNNVVEYAITAEQRNYMIRLGRTVIEYRYKLACAECANQRGYVEAAARDFPSQVFVQEIIDNSANNSTLTMTSYYGDKQLANPSFDEMFEALCELMVEPPVQCATRNI